MTILATDEGSMPDSLSEHCCCLRNSRRRGLTQAHQPCYLQCCTCWGGRLTGSAASWFFIPKHQIRLDLT